MTNEKKFHGVIVAFNSCYNDEGEVDPQRAKAYTRFLLDRGVNGLYVGGSTGEGMLQSADERKRVLEAVLEENAGQGTVIAHIGAITTKESVELARHAELAGADAISSVPPYYYRVSEQGAAKHWNAILAATSLPFIIYHIPATTGFALTPSLLRQMVQNDQVIGVKITSPSPYELQQFKAIGGERFHMFNGPDEQYLAGRVMGASAGIGGTYGAMPELFVQLERSYVAGDLAQAQKVQFQINDIIADLLALPVYSAMKELLKRRGVHCGSVRAPLEEVNDSHKPQLDALYRKLMGYIAEYAPDTAAQA
ncbi:dihydrodipicolinate synthase family protein [Paenibacillus sp. HJGM_3]|uniref:dihydrodipicolinate synthase family protein n=1 Tax=Paenibacillus sp. HJGM_3 TaxID=3379816 RepID=UPI00385C3D0D